MPDSRGAVTNALMSQPSGFTPVAAAPRPPMQAGGFAPPPGAGAGLFAPPPPNMAPAGNLAPTAPSGLFAAPPVAGAPMPSNVVPRTPRPFRQMFSPGALQYPGGNAMRGRGY